MILEIFIVIFIHEENLLVTKNFLKIADFGLAREVPSVGPYTEYVSTRWWVLSFYLILFTLSVIMCIHVSADCSVKWTCHMVMF